MGRRIWIISEETEITDTIREDAKLNGCPEIAQGIPPILKGKIGALPCAYEEPEPIHPEPPRDPLAEIDGIRAELKEKGIL
ncbi:hypothetical protein ES703_13591 [subsurface metagenome]